MVTFTHLMWHQGESDAVLGTSTQDYEDRFRAMLAAIRGASTSINFETYIYWSGDIGRTFADALAERARRGIKTHVLLD